MAVEAALKVVRCAYIICNRSVPLTRLDRVSKSPGLLDLAVSVGFSSSFGVVVLERNGGGGGIASGEEELAA